MSPKLGFRGKRLNKTPAQTLLNRRLVTRSIPQPPRHASKKRRPDRLRSTGPQRANRPFLPIINFGLGMRGQQARYTYQSFPGSTTSWRLFEAPLRLRRSSRLKKASISACSRSTRSRRATARRARCGRRGCSGPRQDREDHERLRLAQRLDDRQDVGGEGGGLLGLGSRPSGKRSAALVRLPSSRPAPFAAARAERVRSEISRRSFSARAA
jgi:hypothetical protein